MFALGAKAMENDESKNHMAYAAELTRTCHESYDRSVTKLGPETFHFTDKTEAKCLKNGEKYYILRPEVIYYYYYYFIIKIFNNLNGLQIIYTFYLSDIL